MREERLCACGCGEALTPDGRGRLYSYRRGHQRRATGPEYVVEDRGYATACWLWARAIGSSGYGRARRPSGGQMTAHRMMYERTHGKLPKHLEPDHLCRVRACVNPDHLQAVTRAENTRRGRKTKLTQAQVDLIRRSDEPSTKLGPRLGVHHSTVRAIRRGKHYKEVV